MKTFFLFVFLLFSFNHKAFPSEELIKEVGVLSTPTNKEASAKKKSAKISSKWELFSWEILNKFNLEWASILGPKSYPNAAPRALQNAFNPEKLLGFFLHFNYQMDAIKFPYFLKWGIRTDIGITRNYTVKKTFFLPLSLSVIHTLEVLKPQYIYPFFELGMSSWWTIEKTKKEFSELFFFWKAGLILSFSIFNKALSYSLPEDYGIQDFGIEIGYKSLGYREGMFLNTLHIATFLQF